MIGHVRATVLVAVLATAGCASVPQIPVTYYDGLTRNAAHARSQLVVSACALRDEVGEDYALQEPSDQRAGGMAQAAGAYLASQGMVTAGPPMLLMCAGVGPDGDNPLHVVASKETKDVVLDGPLPRVLEGSAALGAEDAALIGRLYARLYRTPNTGIQHEGDAPPAPSTGLDAAELAALRAVSGADYLWLLAGDSMEISGGKFVGEAFLTAMLSLGTVVTAQVGGSSDLVALVDLQGDRVLWKKRVGDLSATSTTYVSYGKSGTPTYTPSGGPSRGVGGEGNVWASALFEPLLSPERAAVGQVQVAAEPAAELSPAPVAARVASEAPVATSKVGALSHAFADVKPPPAAATVVPVTRSQSAASAGPVPVVAAPAVPAGEVLSAPLNLYGTPTAGGAVSAVLRAGSRVSIEAVIDNASGRWLFVDAVTAQGWVPESDYRRAQVQAGDAVAAY